MPGPREVGDGTIRRVTMGCAERCIPHITRRFLQVRAPTPNCTPPKMVDSGVGRRAARPGPGPPISTCPRESGTPPNEGYRGPGGRGAEGSPFQPSTSGQGQRTSTGTRRRLPGTSPLAECRRKLLAGQAAGTSGSRSRSAAIRGGTSRSSLGSPTLSTREHAPDPHGGEGEEGRSLRESRASGVSDAAGRSRIGGDNRSG